MKPCAYKVGGRSTCGKPSTHVCLVERIGEIGPQSGSEERCEWHVKMKDVIDAWTHEEVEAMDKE